MAEDDTLVMLNNGWPVGSSSSGTGENEKKYRKTNIYWSESLQIETQKATVTSRLWSSLSLLIMK
jgi:hypothetical protein